jgi:hypothetical protein
MEGLTCQRVACGFMWSNMAFDIIYSFDIILLDRCLITVDGLSFTNI